MPSGKMGRVTNSDSTSSTGALNQAEAQQQDLVRAGTEDIQVPAAYKFIVEQGSHKVTVVTEHGLNYNFHGVCEGCGWEGRYLLQSDAETGAKQHLALKFPSRG